MGTIHTGSRLCGQVNLTLGNFVRLLIALLALFLVGFSLYAASLDGFFMANFWFYGVHPLMRVSTNH